MKFYTAETIDDQVHGYDSQGSYHQLPLGSEVILAVPEEASSQCFILDFCFGNTIYTTQHNLDQFKKKDQFTIEKQIEEVEKIVEVEKEVIKVMTIKDVIGQEIESINFK